MRPSEALEVVAAWHAAVNAGDAERITSLAHEDVEVTGPTGEGRGREVLREWVGRASMSLDPGQTFLRGDTVVVEQRAVWRSSDSGEISKEELIASAFELREGLICRVARYPDLDSALDDTGLGQTDATAGL